MPWAAIAGFVGIAANAAGVAVRCYVNNGPNCENDRLKAFGTFAPVDLAASIIPSLNETVTLRAGREGRLSTNAAALEMGPCGIPAYNYDMCKNELQHVTIQMSIPAPGGTYTALL